MDIEFGYIKLFRRFLDWRWYSDNNTKAVFLHLLLTANSKEKEYKRTTIKRGQLTASYGALAERLGLTVQQVRTAIEKLIDTGEINKQSTNKFLLITICKYDDYQSFEDSEKHEDNNQITIKQQSNNNQITTTNKEYNIISPHPPADARAYTRVSIPEGIEQLKADEIWIENACLMFVIFRQRLIELLDEFVREQALKGTPPETEKELRSHVLNYLRIATEKERKKENEQRSNPSAAKINGVQYGGTPAEYAEAAKRAFDEIRRNENP